MPKREDHCSFSHADSICVAFGLVQLPVSVFSTVVVLLMLPMTFPDKSAALAGAFLNRFAIGLLIPLVKIAIPGWAKGPRGGILLSVPDAIITKATHQSSFWVRSVVCSSAYSRPASPPGMTHVCHNFQEGRNGTERLERSTHPEHLDRLDGRLARALAGRRRPQPNG